MHQFFVYDFKRCSDESPIDKCLLLFYPPEVPDSIKDVLCSQIVGAAQFLREIFSDPYIISLQSRHYALCRIKDLIHVYGSHVDDTKMIVQKLHFICSTFSFFNPHPIEALNDHLDSLSLESFGNNWNYCISMLKNCIFNDRALPNMKQALLLTQESDSLDRLKEIYSFVVGSSIYEDKRLLVSNLNSDVNCNLFLLTMSNMSKLKTDVATSYPLPPNVFLMFVYLKTSVQNEAANRKAKDAIQSVKSSTPISEASQYNCVKSEEKHYKNTVAYSKVIDVLPFDLICDFHSSHVESKPDKHHEIQLKNKSSRDLEFCCFLCSSPREVQNSNYLSLHRDSLHRESVYPPAQHACCSYDERSFNPSMSIDNASQLSDEDKAQMSMSNISVPSLDVVQRSQHVLFIYKLKGITLFSVLQGVPDENQLHGLGNCSYAIVKNCAKAAHKIHDKKTADKGGFTQFNLYQCDTKTFFGNKLLDTRFQPIHKAFISDSSFHSIYIGTYTRSIFASSTKDHQVFYNQEKRSSLKSGWLNRHRKRARKKMKMLLGSSHDF